ncbi:MAG: hypothetical protein NT075_31750, partial [Chloroflexi bacterium]|nr:hypothetical protein [Chloroflexota bacterium]
LPLQEVFVSYKLSLPVYFDPVSWLLGLVWHRPSYASQRAESETVRLLRTMAGSSYTLLFPTACP